MIQEKVYYVNNDGNDSNWWDDLKSSFKKEDEGGLFADSNFGKKVDETFYSKKDKAVAAEIESKKKKTIFPTAADYNFDESFSKNANDANEGNTFATDDGSTTSCNFGNKISGGIFSGFQKTTGTESIPDLAAYLKNAINGVDATGKKKKKKYGIGWVILGGVVAIGLTVLAAKKIKQMRSTTDSNVSVVN